jgi:hypothetical protein
MRTRSLLLESDARLLALVLARKLLSECESWLPPAEIQHLRDQTRLRKTLAGERTSCTRCSRTRVGRVRAVAC